MILKSGGCLILLLKKVNWFQFSLFLSLSLPFLLILSFANPTTYVSKSEAHLEMQPSATSLSFILIVRALLLEKTFVSILSKPLHLSLSGFLSSSDEEILKKPPSSQNKLSKFYPLHSFHWSPKPHRNGLQTSYHQAHAFSTFAIHSRAPKWWRLISWPVV